MATFQPRTGLRDKLAKQREERLGASATPVVPTPPLTQIAQPIEANKAISSANAFDLPTPPRLEPTVATPNNPLVTLGGAGDNFSSLSDDEKDNQILLKQSKGESLTDEERMFRIKQFKANQNVTQDSLGLTGVADEIKGQISGLEQNLETQSAQQKTEREKLIAQKKAELDALTLQESDQLRQAGQREQEAAGTRLSFSGFGRSTFAADQAGQIQKRVEQNVQAVRQAAALQLSLFQRQLEGADEESLQGTRDSINQLKEQARQFELDSASKVAQLNAENKLNFEASFSNLLQTLTPGSQSKVDKNASELLGYVADEFGNPISGEKIPLPKEENATEWGSYKDRFGNTIFYDKSNPTNTTRGNKAKSFEAPDGSVRSSATSDASDMQIVGQGSEYTRDNGTTGLLGENCVKYARSLVPNLPFGLVSKEDKVNAIEFAENEGFGSSDARLAQVGDAILTKEGSWGHAAVISGIDPQTGEFILDEANYKSGQVTNGRRIAPNDPMVIGMVSSSAQPQMSSVINEQGKGEGQNGGVDSQVLIEASDIPKVDFSGSQKAEFLKYEKDPSFIPKSVGSEGDLERFYSEYEVWRKQSENEPVKLDPIDEFKFTRDLRKEFETSIKDPKKAITQIGFIRTSFDKAKSDIKQGKSVNAASQGILVPFQKMLDPTSVVRESEYARSGDGQALLQRLEGDYLKLKQGGAGVTVEGLREFVDTANLFMTQYENSIIDSATPIMAQSAKFGLDNNSILTPEVIKLIERGKQDFKPSDSSGNVVEFSGNTREDAIKLLRDNNQDVTEANINFILKQK